MKKSKVESVDMDSKSLGKKMKALVYLPAVYDSLQRFPVLYFLHGRSGSEHILYELEMAQLADRMIETKHMEPIIIVCPRMDNSQGMNSSPIYREVPDPGDNNRIIHLGMYEDYFIQEVIQTIDSKYRTIQDRSGRYVGGVSAGGYAALHYTLHYQNMFSKAGGHMPALELTLEEEDEPYYADRDMWNRYDPIFIAKTQDISDIDIYLDCGERDEGGFYKGCSILHGILETKGVKSQYHLNSGRHDMEYLRSNMENYFAFYAGLKN